VGALIIVYGNDNQYDDMLFFNDKIPMKKKYNNNKIDIGVTNHMTHGIESFVSYYKWEEGQFVYLGDNSTHEIIG
jgi:hypothetical protein